MIHSSGVTVTGLRTATVHLPIDDRSVQGADVQLDFVGIRIEDMQAVRVSSLRLIQHRDL
jgi:hypothetical protein